MTPREFFEAVEAHPELEWGGVVGAEVEIKAALGRFALTPRAVLDNSWEELEGVLLGRRPAELMFHLARVVGYYSKTSNWNRSKLAELRDRRRGDYALPEKLTKRQEADLAEPLPDLVVEALAAGGADLTCRVGR